MTEKRVGKLVAIPTMQQLKIYEENLAALQLKRSTVELNKPRYVVMCILDISKVVMYKYYYDYMMDKFTDTYSFCYWIPTEKNIYEEIRGDERFDLLNYIKEHPNFSNSNNKVPGKFKDEMGGIPIKEFVGMRAKMYGIKAGEVTKRRQQKVFLLQ